jgi:hypothetical protein
MIGECLIKIFWHHMRYGEAKECPIFVNKPNLSLPFRSKGATGDSPWATPWDKEP